MSGFSIDWLDLREPADLAARNREMLQQIRTTLPEQACIVDLGSGTGSTLRALHSPDSLWRWRLVDLDPVLLAEAARRHGETHALQTVHADLMETGTLPLQDASLVTASALFDLVSAAFVSRLCKRLQASGAGLYAALNYNGLQYWEPAHPLDAAVACAFNDDQRHDKGFGPALGPEASTALQNALEAHGYRVQLADSPWLLDAAQSALVMELVRGIADAVRAALGEQAIQDWQEFRLAHADKGRCIVGHTDLLALPASVTDSLTG